MAQTHNFQQWLYSYRVVFFTLTRAVLGMFLFLKGIYFVFNNQQVTTMLEESSFHINNLGLLYTISIVHICGGALITVGLLTRISIAVQLPVLLGAIFFNFRAQTLGYQSEWLLALAILLLLIFFLVKGPGEISMDAYRRNKQI